MADPHPAPGRLETLRRFINTWYVEKGLDAIAESPGLAAWLHEHGLLERGVAVDERDVAEAQAFREALRALIATNHGHPMTADAEAVLQRVGARAATAFAYEPATRALVLEPRSAGIEHAFARLLRLVYDAQHEATWSRLHLCARETCRWAFYDTSKNHSAQWCEMAVCGNRAKAQRRRARARAA